MQKDLKQIEENGIQIVAISYDSSDILSTFAAKQKITYPLLADPGSKTISAYGLLNKEVKGSKIEGIPYPGTIVIDQEGVIRAKLFNDGYKERATTEELIKAVKSIK